MPEHSKNLFCLSGESLAFLSLRAWLGMRALLTGIEKFSSHVTMQQALLDESGNPDASGALVEVSKKVYGFEYYHAVPKSLQNKFANEPLLPDFLLAPFYASLGYVLIALGLMLLLGLFARLSLFAMALLYTALTVGLILIGQDQGIAWLGIHLALIAFALALAPHNRFAITRS